MAVVRALQKKGSGAEKVQLYQMAYRAKDGRLIKV
jgi:hypothetical protein